MKVKTGQMVKVISGKNKGKTGKIIQVFPKLDKVVVEGVNLTYKHLKRRSVSGSEKGERVEYSAPIHVSNVKVIEETPKEEVEAEKKTEKKKSGHSTGSASGGKKTEAKTKKK